MPYLLLLPSHSRQFRYSRLIPFENWGLSRAYTVRATFIAYGVPSTKKEMLRLTMGNFILSNASHKFLTNLIVLARYTCNRLKAGLNAKKDCRNDLSAILFGNCSLVDLRNYNAHCKFSYPSYPLTGFLRSGQFFPPRLCYHYGYKRQAIHTTTNPPPSYQPHWCYPTSSDKTSNVPSCLSLVLLTLGLHYTIREKQV